MKYLTRFTAGAVVGYIVGQAALNVLGPYLLAKLESLDLDGAWDVFAEEWTE